MYAQAWGSQAWGSQAWGRVHAYQTNEECMCYNCYVTCHSIMLESCLRNVKEGMSQTIARPSLIMKKKPTKHYREEDFCLGIPGWCPCSDCASFSLDASPGLEAGIVETQCSKSLKQKQIEGCKAVKITQQECRRSPTIPTSRISRQKKKTFTVRSCSI